VFRAISILFEVFDLGPDVSWWNYPGLELWKFVNLIVFVLCALYLHRRFGRPIQEGLRSRSEAIKRELQRAQEERDQALAKLTEVEARFSRLDLELITVQEKAKAEADAERDRIRSLTEQEILKMQQQAKREIESAGKVARHELRQFAAQESVRLAEDILEEAIGPEEDARLTNLAIEQLGEGQS
jgi:F0F1-type ATP synthase membrane subunit b/b'